MRLRTIFIFASVAFGIAEGFFLINAPALAGTLTCVVTSTCNSPSVIVLRLASTTNSHAEISSNSSYANLVCCSGVTGLGNSCAASIKAVAVNLSTTTNAHVEEGILSNYSTQACISVSAGTVSVGFTTTSSCTGFDTTILSLSSTTNAHAAQGGTSTFQSGATLQVCGTASSSGATPPTVSNMSLNGAASIVLTPNATTAVSVSATVTDTGGCSLITGGTTTILLYRSGISSSTCSNATSSANCYKATAFTASSTCASNAVNATTTFGVYYYAQATDASSSFASQNWLATVNFTDSTGATGTADSSGQELLTLAGLNVTTSTISYGTLNPGTDTGSTNQVVSVVNGGNASITLNLSGTALTLGVNTIGTSSQHYATSSFTFGGTEQSLSGTPTQVTGIALVGPTQGGAWATTTPLLYNSQIQGGAVLNGFIYNLGGSNGLGGTTTVESSSVSFAPINANGTLGNWSSTTNLPGAVTPRQAAWWNGYIYVVGGGISGVTDSTATVVYAKPSATSGVITNWSSTTALPVKNELGGIFALNGYVYVVGGGQNNTPAAATTTTRFAPINPDGSLGNWSSTTPLPVAIHKQFVAWTSSTVYIPGSEDAGTNVTTTLWYAPINSTGSLGSWNASTVLPFPFIASGAIDDGFIYQIAGDQGGGNLTSTTGFVPVDTNGVPGPGGQGVSYGNTIEREPVLVYNGFLYSIGGHSGALDTTTVKYIPIPGKNVFFGIQVPVGNGTGTYSGTLTLSASYTP